MHELTAPYPSGKIDAIPDTVKFQTGGKDMSVSNNPLSFIDKFLSSTIVLLATT